MIIFIFLTFWLNLFSQSESEIYNRILTDKFFRGVVADNIIENKKYEDMVSGQFYTYSQLRAAVMDWIEKNPKEAAKRFSDILSNKGGYSVSFNVYDYKLNPKLKNLIDKMEDASKKNISDENIRAYASILFDGYKENPDYQLDIKPYKNGLTGQQMKYDYVNLNLEKLYDEVERIDNAYDYLKKFDVKDMEGIIKMSDLKYLEFSKYAISLKGNKRINYEQGEKIKSLLRDVSVMLSLRALLIKYRGIEFNSFVRYSKVIKNFEAGIKKLFLNNDENFSGNFLKIYSKITELEKEISFLNELQNIYNSLLEKSYSCFLDYIIRKLDYSNKYFKIKQRKKELASYFSKILSHNLNEIDSGDAEIMDEKIKESMEIISLENNIKARHRKIQFLFLDNLFPWDLGVDGKKLYFKIKNECIRVR